MNDVVHGSDLSQREKRLLFWASFLSLAAAGGEHEGDGRSGCEQGVVAGPGCVPYRMLMASTRDHIFGPFPSALRHTVASTAAHRRPRLLLRLPHQHGTTHDTPNPLAIVLGAPHDAF